MTTILDTIVAKKREELAALQRSLPLERVREQAAGQPPALDFAAALRGPRPRGGGGSQLGDGALARPKDRAPARPGNGETRIIAEIKRRSPSKGEFAWHGDLPRQVRAYRQGGAAAISVVTDAPFFGGSFDMLREVKKHSPLPVVQKEFVLEPYQVFHARSLGADAVLLIAAILPGGLLGELVALAREVGIATLVEVVDEEQLARAGACGAEVVGVNNRDLRTFATDPARTLRLLPLFDDRQVVVTESGIHTRADVERMLAAGVDGFLIGEALMTAPDPAMQLRQLRGETAAEAAS